MTSMERTLTTLGHREPDRVPLFLLLSMQGARETGTSLEEYYRSPELVFEGQTRLLKKYGHDCFYSFHYAALEYEAFGGEVVFFEDGPPNSGEPVFKKREDVFAAEPPRVADCPGLQRVLEATRRLKEASAGEVPIIGVVMSPFSLPVMQLGFEAYLDLLIGDRPASDRLMRVNEAFCAEWANAQLAAGATAICYFDPVSSSSIITRDEYRATGWPVARRMIKTAIAGPVATHFASGRALPVIDLVAETGTLILGVGSDEDLSALKGKALGKLTLLGNLNGIAMRTWTKEEAARKVRAAIAAGAPGGGFLLSDGHGEIPWQVPDDILMTIAEAVREYGRYPLR